MARSLQTRRVRLPGASRRSESDVRTSEMVLAVIFVALLGVFCLFLLAGLAEARDGSAMPFGHPGTRNGPSAQALGMPCCGAA